MATKVYIVVMNDKKGPDTIKGVFAESYDACQYRDDLFKGSKIVECEVAYGQVVCPQQHNVL
jgi:hypothetical protein